MDDRRRVRARARDVVAVEADVDVAERDVLAQSVDQSRAGGGEDRAAAMDADESELVRPSCRLDDLVRDPHERTPHVVAVEDDLLLAQPALPGLTGPG